MQLGFWFIDESKICSSALFFHLQVVEEVDDPHKIEHLLIKITGYDVAVLDSFAKFVQTAAKVTDLNVTKRYSIIALSCIW